MHLVTPRLLRNIASAKLIGARYLSLSRIQKQEFKDATSQVFEQVVLKGGTKPILVDFYATWCQPCTMLSPVLEKYANNPSYLEGKEFDLMTVNVDEQQELAAKYKINSLPTVIAFKNGQQVDSFVGLLNTNAIRQFIRKLFD